MGVFTDQVQYIASEKKLERIEKQKEKIKKQKEKQQKENIKRYKNELDEFLYYEMDQKINNNYDDFILFYDKEYKKEILKKYYNTIKKYDNNNIVYIPFKSELKKYYYNIYDKILKQVKKENEQQQQYNTYILEQKENTKEADQVTDEKLIDIFKTILIVILSLLFYPLVFLVGIIWRLY